MRFSVLASGSSGNVCYVESDDARVLIDAGLSCRETERRLRGLEVGPETLDALIITHEHADHIRGAGPLSRRYNLPVYINQDTLKSARRTLGNLKKPVIIQTGDSLCVNDLLVETFTKCHDAADPMGLVVSSNGARVGLITDLGRSTRLVEDRLRKCHGLILEFNYDQKMLENGPYPLDVKRRIQGPDGHLSNRQASELLAALSHKGLVQVVLAHLSETNNSETKAYGEAGETLRRSGLADVPISISRQNSAGPLIQL
jgi:phosphoribosyl 1,2-cyclic phosphodiesterase